MVKTLLRETFHFCGNWWLSSDGGRPLLARRIYLLVLDFSLPDYFMTVYRRSYYKSKMPYSKCHIVLSHIFK